MVISDAITRYVALLPWDDADGVREHIVPGALTSVDSDLVPPQRRLGVELRALPNGDAQVLSFLPGGALAVRLSVPSRRVVFEPTGRVIDVLVGADGAAVVLEDLTEGLTLWGLRPDGSRAWSIANAVPRLCAAHLLTDAVGRVFVATNSMLICVQDGQASVVRKWEPGGEPFMQPSGNVAYVLYDPGRQARDWVLLNPVSGVRSTLEGNESTWGILAHAIGVDGIGRAYGHSSQVLGRVEIDGSLGWQVALNGIAVDKQHRISLLSSAGEHMRILNEHGVIPIQLKSPLPDARLIGWRGDASFVLYSQKTGGRYGTLLYINPQGWPIGEEAADKDVWLANDDLRPPSASSVTPTGEVLMAVLSPEGVHIIQVSPRL
jgi:hypothetical protein